MGVQVSLHSPGLVHQALEFLVLLSGGGEGLLDPFLGGVPELDGDGDGGFDPLPLPLVEDRQIDGVVPLFVGMTTRFKMKGHRGSKLGLNFGDT